MYSQSNEEELIEQFFTPSFTGTFLDIGANDGMTFSNTYRLLQKGWQGTMVECSPKVKPKLVENISPYKHQVQILDAAIGPYDGHTDFHESGSLLKKGDSSLVSSISSDETKRWRTARIPFEKISVPMLTFGSMLKRSMYKTFDLVSIDIEGMEKYVIPQIDFKKLNTRMAIIEFNGKDEKFFTDYMQMFGFTLHSKNPENLIYVLTSTD
jgi:FkbM family methyltransferase